MVKPTVLLLFAGLLSACASTFEPTPEPHSMAARPPGGGCYQADWQAQTAPVINKRLGPDALERYEVERADQDPGCH